MREKLNIWRSKRLLFAFGIFAVIPSLIFVYLNKQGEPMQKRVKLWMESKPVSVDPLEYDLFSHHIAFRSVLSGLVTQYRVGKFVGIIAESWTVSPDKKTWTFNIRAGIHFQDGKPISSQDVVASWTRLGFLFRKKQSHSELFETLLGYEGINSPSSRIPGLEATKDQVVLRFTKPNAKLLETLSFGHFSIVDRNDFDSKTGAWKDPKRVNASGPYKISAWNENSIFLDLRSDFLSFLWHPKPVRAFEVTWAEYDRDRSEIIAGFSNEQLDQDSYKFFGSTPANIAYVYCVSWRNSESPCFTIEGRRILRAKLYREMEANGQRLTRSFFPLGMKGIRPFTDPALPNEEGEFSGRKVLVSKSKSNNPFIKGFEKAIAAVAGQVGISLETKPLSFSDFDTVVDSGYVARKLDLMAGYSGILVEDPFADIRFMFLSKEGIRLPDADGSILSSIRGDTLDPHLVNEKIWEQAIVWPLGHFSYGLWVRPELDLSMLNLLLPPTELQWIGQ